MITIDFSLLVAAVLALVEVFKGFKLPTKWCPIVAIVSGISLNFLIGVLGTAWTEQLFYGILVGLSAAGVFDVAKKPIVATKNFVVRKLKKA